jgi:hypothetical protein
MLVPTIPTTLSDYSFRLLLLKSSYDSLDYSFLLSFLPFLLLYFVLLFRGLIGSRARSEWKHGRRWDDDFAGAWRRGTCQGT